MDEAKEGEREGQIAGRQAGRGTVAAWEGEGEKHSQVTGPQV